MQLTPHSRSQHRNIPQPRPSSIGEQDKATEPSSMRLIGRQHTAATPSFDKILPVTQTQAPAAGAFSQ
jgi:hypothetical protein